MKSKHQSQIALSFGKLHVGFRRDGADSLGFGFAGSYPLQQSSACVPLAWISASGKFLYTAQAGNGTILF